VNVVLLYIAIYLVQFYRRQEMSCTICISYCCCLNTGNVKHDTHKNECEEMNYYLILTLTLSSMYRLPHQCVEWIMRRALGNSRQCCNMLISWPTYEVSELHASHPCLSDQWQIA